MRLEDQRPGDLYLRQQLEQRRAELLAGKWSDLWR
jgi:hypothetical protein